MAILNPADVPDLAPMRLALVALAAAGGGAVNAIAGGGTLLTFPALIGLGVGVTAALSTSGVSLPSWPMTSDSAEAPRRFLPRPRSIRIMAVSPASVLICGVSDLRTSYTGAKAETISETGEVTAFESPSSFHVVRIDSESLPTGMLMPSAGHSSMPTALTVSNRAASWPGWPQAAIQLADSLMSEMSPIAAAAMLVTASPTAMRPEAAALMTASGVRSPIAIASPR